MTGDVTGLDELDAVNFTLDFVRTDMFKKMHGALNNTEWCLLLKIKQLALSHLKSSIYVTVK